MVVEEDTSAEIKIENHEEFVDSQSEPEPVFTVKSILFNIFDSSRPWVTCNEIFVSNPYGWMYHNLYGMASSYCKIIVFHCTVLCSFKLYFPLSGTSSENHQRCSAATWITP
jgi:hypothetical protein